MGNGNTRPAKALTGFKKEEGVPPAQRHDNTDRSGRTTTVTILENSNSSPAAYTSEGHLVAPSSNPYLPAAPPAPCSKSSPSLAPPVRIVFSASLERSLQSSGKRRSSAQRSSSSWTPGDLTRDSKRGIVEQTASSSTSTKTIQLTKERLGVPTRSTAGVSAGRCLHGGITKRAASTRRWKHSRDGCRAPSSQAGHRGGGSTTTTVETIIDTNSSSPSRPRRGQRNLHDPSSRVRPSAAVVAVGASRALVRKEEENQAEKKWVENSMAHQILSLTKQQQQQQQQQQNEDGNCKGGREQQHSSHRAPRSEEGTLPTVKCWEGSAIVAGRGASGAEGETKLQRPRQRRVRSRSCVDTASPPRTESTGEASTGIADDRKTRDTMEGRTSEMAVVVGRNEEGVCFGRESSDASRIRLRGRGGAGVRAVHGNGTGGGSGGFSSGMLLRDERKPASGAALTASSSPPPLQLSASSTAEDAACCDLEDSLSVCSSLPPMSGSATITTDLIFEESSLEDSGASVSQASSTERNWNENVGGSGSGGGVAKSEGGGGSGRGKRGVGGSAGRGLSNLMARIHEQEECKGGALESPRDPLPRGIGSRPSTGETFRVQELSDSDHDGHEAGLATPPLSSSPTAEPSAASGVMNVGHQRAALELRNLTLEREVEQLKTHLRNLGGDDVTVSDRRGVRRPRPRPQHRIGERALLHRSAAPSPLSEASAFVSRRGGGDCCDISCGSGSDVSARGQAEAGRARRGDSTAVHPSRRSPAGGATTALSLHQKNAGGAEAASTASGSSSAFGGKKVQPAPSPPRKRGSRRTLAAATAAVEPFSAFASSSPARQLRTNRLRSPTSTSTASTVEVLLPKAGKGSEAARSLGIGIGGLDAVVGTSHMSHMNTKEDEPSQEMGQALGQDTSSGVVTEPRPLPRLRREEAERRRASKARPRAAKTPINLGGMVSGIKHTLLSRRRSTGDNNTQLVTPAGSLSAVRGSQAFGRNKNIPDDDDHPTALSNGDKTTPSTTAATAAATATGKEFDQAENGRWGSGRPTRGEENHPSSAASSSSKQTISVTPAAAAPAVEHQQGGWNVPEDLGEVARAEEVEEAEEELCLEVVSTKQAAAGAGAAATKEANDEAVVETGETEAAQNLVAAVATTMECGASGGGAGVVNGTDDAANDSPKYGRWPATLDAQWAEVEFMLCHEVDCEESLQYTIEATESGLVFMDKLEEKAQELGILKGQLSRWLLPFNTDTSVDEQQAATPRRFQESLLASSAISGTAGGASAGTLTEEEAEYLTAGARRVRQLVRLKIADDNDLNTAKEALVTMAGFFVNISEEAAKRGGSATPFGVLQERRAMSPITRPPPLPSIPRPCTATQAAATTKENDDNTTTTTFAKQANARQSDDGGRGTSRTLAPTIKPASVAGPSVLAVERANRGIGGRSTPEANGGRNHSGMSSPLAVDGTSHAAAAAAAAGEILHEDRMAAAEDTAKWTTSAQEPDEAMTTPRDVSREYTPAAGTQARTPEIPRSLGVVDGSQQGQVAGTALSSSPPIASTIAASTRGGDDVGSPSSNIAEHRQVGRSAAPAGSLVRLKRRRQQTRTRSSSQR